MAKINAQRCILAAAKGGYPDGQQRLLISHQCKLASEKVLVELFLLQTLSIELPSQFGHSASLFHLRFGMERYRSF